MSPQSVPISVKRRVFSLPTLASLALAGALLAFLISRFDVNLGATWDHVRSSNPWYLALAVLVHYSTFLFRGARWRLLLQNAQGKDASTPGLLYCSQLVLLGWFASSVTWFRLGDAYRAYLYHDEQGASFPRTVGTILAERLVDAIIVVLLLLVAVLLLVTGSRGMPLYSHATMGVLGIAIAVLVVLAFLLLAMKWTRRWLIRRLPRWLAEGYGHFQEGSTSSLQQLPMVGLFGLTGWLAEAGRLYLVVRTLGLDLSPGLAIFIAVANSLLTLVPTPGGVGAVESGVAGLLVSVSALTTSAAAALVLVDRSISYLSIIVTGGILFLARQVLGRRRRQECKAPAIEHP